jgi:predicted dehydrogenase
MKSSMAVGAGLALAGPASRVLGANDDIRVAVVGVGGQGGGHMKYFGEQCKGVRLVAICDADRDHVEKRAADFEKKNGVKLKTYTDVRELLEDRSIDAITSATPNHWHSLVTIWACQAGKDVYIEKPVSHEIWEGRKMVEAARKYNRIVQTGTQKRSSEAHPAAYEWMRQGNLGKIKWVRSLCYKGRFEGTNGIVNGTNGPNPLPESIDYNLWCGPADMEPLRRKSLHYKWHWVWNTGNGDLGNQGIHEMDLGRWALGDPKLAPRVMSFGGRFRVNDAGETANTQIVFFDYKPAPLIFEVRGFCPARKATPRWTTGVVPGPASASSCSAKTAIGPRATAAATSGTTTTSGPTSVSSAVAAQDTIRTSSMPFAAANAATSTPTSRKATSPARCATWATSRTGWA